MKMTYRELINLLNNMTESQKDCDVTVEDSCEDECFPAELRICGVDHPSLDNNHPVIYF